MTYNEISFWEQVYERVIQCGFTNEVARHKADLAITDRREACTEEKREDDVDDPD